MSDERAASSVDSVPPPPAIPRGMAMIVRIGFAIGGLLLVVAAVLAVREAVFIAHSTSATATVAHVDREWMSGRNSYRNGSGGNWGYRIVASFSADGRTIDVRSPSLVSFTGYRVGDAIRVEYPPGRPDQAQLVRFVDRWMLELVLGIIGAAFVAMGTFAVWLTRLPGARITTGGSSFHVRSPVYSVDVDLKKPSTSSSTTKRTPWLIALVLIAGIAIGIVVARRGDTTRRSPAFSGASGRTSPIDTSVSTAPGFPPNLIVKAPPMPDDEPQPISWTDPHNGGATAQNLTMAARAFIARPEQDASMQSALRAKAAQLGLSCPGNVFQPRDTTLLPAPTPRFDAGGTMRQGLIRQRFAALGCPGPASILNVWVFAAGDGLPVKIVAGYPGTTRADPQLMRDATPVVLAIAARLAPGCQSLAVIDTHLVAPAPADGATPWTENWLVGGCGKRIALTVRFFPDPARRGTRIEVPDTLARVVSQ